MSYRISLAARVAIGMVLGLAVGIPILSWLRAEPEGPEVESDAILESWHRISGAWWLKPNLDQALLVQPDRPHWRAEVVDAQSNLKDMKRKRSYRLSTSSQRLRNEEIGPKPEGVIRVVAIGDSVTHGWGVARHEAYPAQLQKTLRNAGYRVEVINAGVPAVQLNVMRAWCETVAIDFDVDWILWTRRPTAHLSKPMLQYRDDLQACQAATGARVLAVLNPVSTFDMRGEGGYQHEEELLRQALGPNQPVLELTHGFRLAQEGRGVTLRDHSSGQALVDQSSGEILLELSKMNQPGVVNKPGLPPLDPRLYTFFEENPDAREALFFDEGHPDAEGFVLFAELVAEALVEQWKDDSRGLAPAPPPPPAGSPRP